MRWSAGRFVLLFAFAALAACSAPAARESYSFAMPAVDRAQPHAETSVKFYVYNGTSRTLQQSELGGYCVPTMAARDINPGSTVETVVIAPGCLTTAAFNVRLRDAVVAKSIYFSANYETVNGIFSQAKVSSVAIPFTGICTNTDPEAAVLYISPCTGGGGGTTYAKHHGVQTFDLRVENRTGIDLVARTVWSYCMKKTVRGRLASGVTLDSSVATKGGSPACDHLANFLTYYYAPHSTALIAQIEWTFGAPHKVLLAVDGDHGYCAKSYPKGGVRLYRATGIYGCF